MVGAEEISNENGSIQFSLRVTETKELRPKPEVRAAETTGALAPYQINISGSQLLIGLVSALCAVGFMLWAFCKLWLFE